METRQLERDVAGLMEDLSQDTLNELYEALRLKKEIPAEPILHLSLLIPLIIEDAELLRKLSQK